MQQPLSTTISSLSTSCTSQTRDVAEGQAHIALQEYRVNPNKEFFRAPLLAVVQALDRVANQLPVPLGRTAKAGLLAQPLVPTVKRYASCGTENRIPQVLIPIRVKCGACPNKIAVSPGAT